MGVMTIGRIEIEEGSAPDPGMTWDGDRLSFSGVLKAETIDEAKALRAQVQGLVDSVDEPVVPVTWADDDTVDGFYRVLGASVGSVGASYAAAWFPFEVDLERVAGWKAPIFESVLRGALRTNSHSITNGSYTVALPFSSTMLWEWPSGTTQSNRTSESGTMTVVSGSGMASADVTWSVGLEDYYLGAASISSLLPDGKPFPVLGRQTDMSVERWSLSNGLVRVHLGPVTGNLEFYVQTFDGSAWNDPLRYGMSSSSPPETVSTGYAPSSVTIMRNSPEVCTVRTSWRDTDGGTVTAGIMLDFTVRRGSRWIECTETIDDGVLGAGGTRGVVRSVSEAATALTGGIRATSDDADGNRYMLAGADTDTNNVTVGGIGRSSSTTETFTFGVGTEVGGSGGAAIDDATVMLNQFYAAQSERQQIAAR